MSLNEIQIRQPMKRQAPQNTCKALGEKGLEQVVKKATVATKKIPEGPRNREVGLVRPPSNPVRVIPEALGTPQIWRHKKNSTQRLVIVSQDTYFATVIDAQAYDHASNSKDIPDGVIPVNVMLLKSLVTHYVPVVG